MVPGLRRAVGRVAVLNLGGFGVEFVAALLVGSVSLFADSIDFLEDASLNLLVLAALGWDAARRVRLGRALAGLLLVPGLAALWTAWGKLGAPMAPEPVAPDPLALGVVGLGALAVNLCCALLLARVHRQGGSLTRAAFLSARNDVLANLAIIGAALLTALAWRSAWPDVVVGLAIAAVNAGAAREVWLAARAEGRAAEG